MIPLQSSRRRRPAGQTTNEEVAELLDSAARLRKLERIQANKQEKAGTASGSPLAPAPEAAKI